MTYAIYYIHLQSLSVNIYNFYEKYNIAVKKLNDDVEDYIKTSKKIDHIKYINNKLEIVENGYYFKISKKYPNRINIYEKTTNKIDGYIFSSNISDIKKIYVFSLLELSLVPENSNYDILSSTIPKIKDDVPQIELLYIQELKDKIKNRLGKYD
jgi:hypothetical protein